MKRFSILFISAIAAWGIATPVPAQPRTIGDRQANLVVGITPYNLVTASYQGQFTEQGIPSGSKFITATRLNQIDAKDLVQSAIAAGRLSEATGGDREYLYRVNSILVHLSRT